MVQLGVYQLSPCQINCFPCFELIERVTILVLQWVTALKLKPHNFAEFNLLFANRHLLVAQVTRDLTQVHRNWQQSAWSCGKGYVALQR